MKNINDYYWMEENHMYMKGFADDKKDNENYETFCEFWNSYIDAAAQHRLKQYI